MAIAHHKAVSALRKRGEFAMDEAALACCPDDADTPEVATQKRNKAEVMRACMERLSSEHRAIIDLVYYHDKSVAEAAEITGVPVATVKTRMFYARKKLAELMREAGLDRGWP
jgi:RNA polymerase sigma-70 factor (ECF subfamily)